MFAKGTHAKLKKSIDSIGASIALYEMAEDQSAQLISANLLYEEISGMPVENMIGVNLNVIFPRYLEALMQAEINSSIAEQLPSEAEYVIDREGKIRWWRFIFSPVVGESGAAHRVLNTCVEITDKKQLELSLETSRSRFEAVVESAYDGIISIDANRSIKLMNKAAQEIFGYVADELLGQPLECLLPKKFRNQHKGYVAGFAASPVRARPMHARAAVRGLRKDGSEFSAEVTISKIKVGHEMEMTAVVRDISERSKLIEELQKAAIEDGLTGLYNRRHLERIINRELLRCDRFGCVLSLILFDVDSFKQINDRFGHEGGDQVLKTLAQIVPESIREVDVFGRWGGDEFLVILPETKLESAAVWAEKTRQMLAEIRVPAAEQSIGFTCSFGVVERSHEQTSVSELVAQADANLYQAKRAGRNCVKTAI